MPAAVVANGSIYQPSAYGNYPLFEDRRPRNVGDIVTIMIQERTNAAKNVSTNTDRTGSGGLDFTGVPAFLPNEVGSKQNFEVSGSNKAQGKGSSRADNTFSGTLTTTVVGVLPNGICRWPVRSRSPLTVAASTSAFLVWWTHAPLLAAIRCPPPRWPMPVSSFVAKG